MKDWTINRSLVVLGRSPRRSVVVARSSSVVSSLGRRRSVVVGRLVARSSSLGCRRRSSRRSIGHRSRHRSVVVARSSSLCRASLGRSSLGRRRSVVVASRPAGRRVARWSGGSVVGASGGARLISRNVGGPALRRLWVGGKKQKQENTRGPGGPHLQTRPRGGIDHI